MYSAVLKTNDGQDEQSGGGMRQNLSIGSTISGVAKKMGTSQNSCLFVLVGRAHNQRGRTGFFFILLLDCRARVFVGFLPNSSSMKSRKSVRAETFRGTVEKKTDKRMKRRLSFVARICRVLALSAKRLGSGPEHFAPRQGEERKG